VGGRVGAVGVGSVNASRAGGLCAHCLAATPVLLTADFVERKQTSGPT
jgi:hypothetical protein